MLWKVGYVSLEIIGLERNNALYYTIKENPKEQIRRAVICLSLSLKLSINTRRVCPDSSLGPRPSDLSIHPC